MERRCIKLSEDINNTKPKDKKSDTRNNTLGLFSEQEINEVVKEFIKAYICGKVNINFIPKKELDKIMEYVEKLDPYKGGN